ncbi:MAG: 30S ribosomal protein S3 [Candidatus Woesearchaeota archaeon]|jgi:small subunit ribosomal protein S3|nr:30S ribosomal protein S3 [Candidatus Woesearchaeota archaeon]MDP7198852.1 30S ribosomal protein S3 [Candidatus Woesearchaeota archaeon]MDP7467148.1 30S ribosomal protein S3 [Candidatus Woesearchaeota archaeon]MDP7647517.1 30S ribosomal protein S3 [Candidatus Woesearchaeota archaeon]
MIERKFIQEKVKEFEIQEYIDETLTNVGHAYTRLFRTPLGEKIVIYTSRPGLVVGKKGENIKKLTTTLKKKFGLENPQLEISEIENPNTNPTIVAERISSSLERFGIQRFKAIAHRTMSDVNEAGAQGVEITISGKVPSSRARTWRFHTGHIEKCGNMAIEKMGAAYSTAYLKSGAVGITVRITPPELKLPDSLTIVEEQEVKDEKEGTKEPTAERTEKNAD